MLKEVSLKEALAAMADGEKVIMLDTDKGTAEPLDELIKPVFQKGVRFLQDAEVHGNVKEQASGKRPGRKQANKQAPASGAAGSPSGSAFPVSPGKEPEDDTGSADDPDPSGDSTSAVEAAVTVPPANKAPLANRPESPGGQGCHVKEKRDAAREEKEAAKREMEKKAIEFLAMGMIQKEIASSLGTSQPVISKIAQTHKKEIEARRSGAGGRNGMSRSKIEYLKEHQGDPDDGTRKCGSCVYRCQTKSHWNCSYTLITGEPRGCVPWRCFRYKKAVAEAAAQ